MTDQDDTARMDAGSPDDHPEAQTDLSLDATIESVLVTLDRPTPSSKLAEALSSGGDADVGVDDIEAAVDRLNEAYEGSGRSFRIERVGGGLRLMTLPAYAPAIACVRKSRESGRLSRAALETLAIVAYRQPITRAELEAIRGVACGEVLRSLLDRKFVMIKGRAEELGRPMLYGTTKHFLDQFGLASLKDLPASSESEGTRSTPAAAEVQTKTPAVQPEPEPIRTGEAADEG